MLAMQQREKKLFYNFTDLFSFFSVTEAEEAVWKNDDVDDDRSVGDANLGRRFLL